MDATTIAIDLAKRHFEVAFATGTRIAHRRLTRAQCEQLLRKHSPTRLVMEACGSAHHWARSGGAPVLPNALNDNNATSAGITDR